MNPVPTPVDGRPVAGPSAHPFVASKKRSASPSSWPLGRSDGRNVYLLAGASS